MSKEMVFFDDDENWFSVFNVRGVLLSFCYVGYYLIL